MLATANPKRQEESDANGLKRLVLDEIENKVSVYHACKKFGISRTRFYNEWLADDPDFKLKFEQIRLGHIDGIEGNLLDQALHNPKAVAQQIFALKAWKPERYSERIDAQAVTVNVNLSNGSLDTINKALAILGKKEQLTAGEFDPSLEIKPASFTVEPDKVPAKSGDVEHKAE